MVDILLINPPLVDYEEMNKPFFLVNTSFFPPIGLSYLASYLNKYHFSSKIIDMDAEKFGLSKVDDLIRIYDPLIVGIGITSDLIFPISYKIIKRIKEISDLPLIVGGVFSTNNPKFLIDKTEIDFVVRGEGEITLLELMRFFKKKNGNLNDIEGLSFKLGGKIQHNPDRKLITNLDEIPFPDLNDFDLRKYFISISYKNPSFAITASRGCPFRCMFCSTSVFQYYRVRSPKNVVDEIEYLYKEYNIKDLTFHDPTFNVNKNWVIKFCKELISRRIDIKWRCLCRVDNIDETIVKYMKVAGCYNIAFGIESSKDKHLDFLRKDFNISQVRNAVKIVKKYRIEILAYFMFGIPGQTIRDIQHNIKFIKKISPDYINILILNPVTGTDLWTWAEQKKMLINFNLEDFHSPERLGVEKQWWNIPNLNESILKYFIRIAYIRFFFSLHTFKSYFYMYVLNPMRLLYAIKNTIQRFLR